MYWLFLVGTGTGLRLGVHRRRPLSSEAYQVSVRTVIFIIVNWRGFQ